MNRAGADEKPPVKLSVGLFVLRALLWLPICFAVWYFAAAIILLPLKWLLNWVLTHGFPDIFSAIDLKGHSIIAHSFLQKQGGTVDFETNALIYTFGFPMFLALTLAAWHCVNIRSLLIGILAQLPFQVFSVAADFFTQLAIGAGASLSAQAGFGALSRETIAYSYQVGTLILPAVVPAIVWVALHRRWLEGWRI